MTTRFVNELRSRSDTLQLASAGDAAITVRVEMPEKWDTVKASVAPTASVLTVKLAALEALYPAGEVPADFVLKLRGWEVLDENASLTDLGAVNGSIFLLTHRRRRPVR